MGRALLQHHVIQDHELVARPGLWHSRAQVIEGRFNVLPSETVHQQQMKQQLGHASREDLFWCDKVWDPATGQVLHDESKPQHIRKSCSLSSRFIFA